MLCPENQAASTRCHQSAAVRDDPRATLSFPRAKHLLPPVFRPDSNTSAGPAGSERFITPVGGTSACRGRHSSRKQSDGSQSDGNYCEYCEANYAAVVAGSGCPSRTICLLFTLPLLDHRCAQGATPRCPLQRAVDRVARGQHRANVSGVFSRSLASAPTRNTDSRPQEQIDVVHG